MLYCTHVNKFLTESMEYQDLADDDDSEDPVSLFDLFGKLVEVDQTVIYSNYSDSVIKMGTVLYVYPSLHSILVSNSLEVTGDWRDTHFVTPPYCLLVVG